jgi:hypothetical protein
MDQNVASCRLMTSLNGVAYRAGGGLDAVNDP